MRTREEVLLVDELLRQGLNDCEIARRTGIPRGTVRDWRSGRQPRHGRQSDFGPAHAPPTIPVDRRRHYAHVLGLYLGDGDISRLRRTYRLRITLDGIYPEIVAMCAEALGAMLPNRVHIGPSPSRAVIVSVYSNLLPRLFPQHGPGMKHTRRIALAPWQSAVTRRHPEDLIRGLIHSDGTRHLNSVRARGKTYAYPRYQFSNRSDDIRGIFCEHLDLLEIPWRRMNRWTISVARREGVARLDEFVGPKR